MNKIIEDSSRSDFYKGYNFNRNIENKLNEKIEEMYKLIINMYLNLLVEIFHT